MPGLEARATVYAAAYAAARVRKPEEDARREAREAVDDFLAHATSFRR